MTEQEAKEKLLELKLEQHQLEMELKTYPKPSKNQKYLKLDTEFKEYNECRDKIMVNKAKASECKLYLKSDIRTDATKLIILKNIMQDNFTIEQMKVIYKILDEGDRHKSIVFSTDKVSFKNELLITLNELKSIRRAFNEFMNESERIMNREEFGSTIKTMSTINKSIPIERDINERISKYTKL